MGKDLLLIVSFLRCSGTREILAFSLEP